MIAAWEDYRTPSTKPYTSNIPNIYAQRVRADGSLGGDVVAALVSLAGADATLDRVSVRWFTDDASIGTVGVERNAGDGWVSVGQLAPDGGGFLRYEDHDVVAGRRYGYRLRVTLDGRETALGETWITVPARAEFALRSISPNPNSEDLAVTFALADSRPAVLELLDIAGRRVLSREVGALGPGSHTVSLAREASELRPGVYAVPLRSAARAATLRAVRIR
jgi:hypothetical protein